MQESDHQPNLVSKFSTPDTHASKKRKMCERVVVAVKIEENDKKQQRNEGHPDDCWSWRKYGQKPIKGSPYPRGYYRCSTSKGCSAKKQVEKCKTDASMLIITYTSTHNHPGPDFSLLTNQKQAHIQTNSLTATQPTSPKQEQELPQQKSLLTNPQDPFQWSQSPVQTIVNQEENPFQETANVVYSEDQKPLCKDSVGFSAVLKSEDNDFYDELEALPTSSFFTAFMRSSFCEERATLHLST